jgi:L-ascorbate metabolism protein UlaG (beta-lactamase superfamily)
MKLKWLGHACFLMTSDKGTRILIDPFDEKVGYAVPVVEADIVTCSHGHGDHANTAIAQGSFSTFREPGHYLEKGVEIIGISTYHDEDHGAKRGLNTVFKFIIDGIGICHCGDLGHALTDEQVSQLGKVDVLLVPVGGTYTLDAAGAAAVMGQLKPSVTIPMHFKTPELNFPLDTADSFLKATGKGEMAEKQEIVLEQGGLQAMPEILILNYK